MHDPASYRAGYQDDSPYGDFYDGGFRSPGDRDGGYGDGRYGDEPAPLGDVWGPVPAPAGRRSASTVIMVAVVLLLLAGGAGAAYLLTKRDGDNAPAAGPSAQATGSGVPSAGPSNLTPMSRPVDREFPEIDTNVAHAARVYDYPEDLED